MTASRTAARAAAAAVLLSAAVLAVAAALARPAGADTLDDRVYAIASRLMCPVCAGQTVAESDSAVAREMRDVIRARLRAGETPAQILSFFVGQFGEGVLAEPPRHGLSYLLYLGPAAGVLGGLATALLFIRRWTARRDGGAPARGSQAPGRDVIQAEPSAPDEDRARLARELEARERF